MQKRKVKFKTGDYWTQETDEAIKLYNSNPDDELFKTKIYPALRILAESLYSIRKFQYLTERDNNINDLLTHLTLQLKNFKGEKGNGFSYFSVVAVRYMQQANMRLGKNHDLFVEVEQINKHSHGHDEEYEPKAMEQYYHQSTVTDNKEFIKLFCDEFEKQMPQLFLPKGSKFKVAKLIIHLLRNYDTLDDKECKHVRPLIKEKLGSLSHCTYVDTLKVINKAYYNCRKRYLNTGKV